MNKSLERMINHVVEPTLGFSILSTSFGFFLKLNELYGKEAVKNVIKLVVENKNKPLEMLL